MGLSETQSTSCYYRLGLLHRFRSLLCSDKRSRGRYYISYIPALLPALRSPHVPTERALLRSPSITFAFPGRIYRLPLKVGLREPSWLTLTINGSSGLLWMALVSRLFTSFFSPHPLFLSRPSSIASLPTSFILAECLRAPWPPLRLPPEVVSTGTMHLSRTSRLGTQTE